MICFDSLFQHWIQFMFLSDFYLCVFRLQALALLLSYVYIHVFMLGENGDRCFSCKVDGFQC